jgi:hypothetical protein
MCISVNESNSLQGQDSSHDIKTIFYWYFMIYNYNYFYFIHVAETNILDNNKQVILIK